MATEQGFYALLQFSPVPDRFEFVNIGVVLFAPDRHDVRVKFSSGWKRVEKLFGKQERGNLNVIRDSFKQRLRLEFSEPFSREKLERFAKSRANNLRMSNILPIVIEHEPDVELAELFKSLVGEDENSQRLPRVADELKKKFERAGVDKLLQKPEPIELPQGVTIEAPYGYQNGSFNLIDPVRLVGEPEEALAQASKRAIEGQWLLQYSKECRRKKKLIVVGDFTGQQSPFVDAVHGMMKQHEVDLYDLRDIDPLVADIREHAARG